MKEFLMELTGSLIETLIILIMTALDVLFSYCKGSPTMMTIIGINHNVCEAMQKYEDEEEKSILEEKDKKHEMRENSGVDQFQNNIGMGSLTSNEVLDISSKIMTEHVMDESFKGMIGGAASGTTSVVYGGSMYQPQNIIAGGIGGAAVGFVEGSQKLYGMRDEDQFQIKEDEKK